MKKDNNREALQEIKLCVKTFFNLYGTMPSTQVMLDWLDSSYEKLIPEYMKNPVLA